MADEQQKNEFLLAAEAAARNLIRANIDTLKTMSENTSIGTDVDYFLAGGRIFVSPIFDNGVLSGARVEISGEAGSDYALQLGADFSFSTSFNSEFTASQSSNDLSWNELLFFGYEASVQVEKPIKVLGSGFTFDMSGRYAYNSDTGNILEIGVGGETRELASGDKISTEIFLRAVSGNSGVFANDVGVALIKNATIEYRDGLFIVKTAVDTELASIFLGRDVAAPLGEAQLGYSESMRAISEALGSAAIDFFTGTGATTVDFLSELLGGGSQIFDDPAVRDALIDLTPTGATSPIVSFDLFSNDAILFPESPPVDQISFGFFDSNFDSGFSLLTQEAASVAKEFKTLWLQGEPAGPVLRLDLERGLPSGLDSAPGALDLTSITNDLGGGINDLIFQSFLQESANDFVSYFEQQIVASTLADPDLLSFVQNDLGSNIIKPVFDSNNNLSGFQVLDENGVLLSETQYILEERIVDGQVVVVPKLVRGDGAFKVTNIPNDPEGLITVQLPGAAEPINLGALGASFGSFSASFLDVENDAARVAVDGVFRALGENLFQTAGARFVNDGPSGSLSKAFSEAWTTLPDELVDGLLASSISNLSSFLTAQLINELIGVEGVGGQLLQSVTNSGLTPILNNIATHQGNFSSWDNVFEVNNFANALGGFAGAQLAGVVSSAESVAGQIGSGVGSILGPALGQSFIPVPFLGTFVGSFFGNLLGGVIGDLIGDPPTAFANLEIDPATGDLIRGESGEDGGGPIELVENMADSVGDSFSLLFDLLDGDVIRGGFDEGLKSVIGYDAGDLYFEREIGVSGRVTFVQDDYTSGGGFFSSPEVDTGQQINDLLDYVGSDYLTALRDSGFEVAGGNVIIKRAFFNSLDNEATVDATLDEVLGNLLLAEDYAEYLENRNTINFLLQAAEDRAYTAEWLTTLAYAENLNLHRRHEADWFGGFEHFFDRNESDIATVNFQLDDQQHRSISFDKLTGGAVTIDDYVALGDKTLVLGADGDDSIMLKGDFIDASGTSSGRRDVDITIDLHSFAGDQKVFAAPVINVGRGNDVVFAGDLGADVLGGAGDDALVGGVLDDWLFGGDDDDILDAGGGDHVELSGHGDYLDGGAGDDRIRGDAKSDWLAGGAGNDVIHAGADKDIIEGGSGSDTVDGALGADIYLYRNGDGMDFVSDRGADGEIDEFRFVNALAADIQFVRLSADDDILAVIGPAGDQNWVVFEEAGSDGVQSIDRLVLSDGQVMSFQDVFAGAVSAASGGLSVSGVAGDEMLTGSIFDDAIHGAAGADRLVGSFGSDTYFFNLGDGADVIFDQGFAVDVDRVELGVGLSQANITVSRGTYEDGEIILDFGGGDSLTLQGVGFGPENSVDSVHFSDGSSWTAFDLRELYFSTAGAASADNILGFATDDVITGGNGDDTITGGEGDDYLLGGAHNDTYVYNVGDGHDVINDANGTDRIVFGAGISIDDLRFARDIARPYEVTISFANAIGSLTINNQASADNNTIELFEFADGASLTSAELQALDLSMQQTAGGENIVGSRSADVIDGLGGDDYIIADFGNDTITGGTGDDHLFGGADNDTYVYNVGDGHDIISDLRGTDTLVFGAGIAIGDLRFTRDIARPYEVTISFANAQGSIKILEQAFQHPSYRAIELFEFADGTSLTGAELQALDLSQQQTAGGENIVGSRSADVINGLGGDDYIIADFGNDTITGGAGDDYLRGGADNDTYVYNVGDGHDIINDANGTDKLVFGAGIAIGDLRFSRDIASPYQVIISFANVEGSIKILEQAFQHPSYKAIELFEFADGTSLTGAELQALDLSQQQTAGGENIVGSRSADVINGLGGDDYIIADFGNDTITGGAGDDYLLGGADNDTYVYNVGDGYDIISDLRGTDTLVFGAGIAIGDLRFSRDIASPYQVIISFANAEGSIKILEQAFQHPSYKAIELFEFADGTSLTGAELQALDLSQQQTAGGENIVGSRSADVIDGLGGDDLIVTDFGNDTIMGGTGEDYLLGGADNDTYVYNLGDGHDVINDSSGNDTLVFGAGIAVGDLIVEDGLTGVNSVRIAFNGSAGSVLIVDQKMSSKRIDTFQFDDGSTLTASQLLALAGPNGDDILGQGAVFGTSASERIITSTANDTLSGGAGNDRLIGGRGDDTYVFNLGDGHDVIFDESGGADRIEFGAGISASDLRIVADGGNIGTLRILIGDGADSITVEGSWRIGDGASTIESFVFSNGAILDTVQFLALRNQAAAPTDDRLGGTNFAELIEGGAGDDYIFSDSGNDTLIGGTGDDRLVGAFGDDTYVFNLGDGHDVIYDTLGNNDRIEFGAGIAVSDLRVIADGDTSDLRILIGDGSDSITIETFTPSDGSTMEAFVFSDGTVLNTAEFLALRNHAAAPTDDRLIGTSFSELIEGGDGDDYILSGSGDDTLIGGRGDDRLVGSNNSDTYIFNLGDGHDIISDSIGDNDRIEFGAGIAVSDLRVIADGDIGDVRILIGDGSDSITIWAFWQTGGGATIEEFAFSDGTVLNTAQFLALRNHAAAPTDDRLGGTNAADLIEGGDGDDYLFGRNGEDTLIGGRGDDRLEGSNDSDTYIFNVGDGDDVINDRGGSADQIVFGAGIAVSDLRVIADGDIGDVRILIGDGSDSITVENFWETTGRGATIESFVFNDGAVLNTAEFLALRNHAAAPTDDRLAGMNSPDLIVGGDGDDYLYGRNGNDTLIGGRGDDRLLGLRDSDTYLFNLGDGNDVIVEDNGNDTLIFGSGVYAEDLIFDLDPLSFNNLRIRIQGTDDSIIITNFKSRRVETISFESDAKTLSYNDVLALLGANGANGQKPGATSGDDVITTGLGDDTLEGHEGDDILRGGDGSDTYSYSRGDGRDVIFDGSEAGDVDRLVLTDILQSEVSISQSLTDADDIVISIGADGGSIYLDQQKAGFGIEEIQFADGTILSASAFNAVTGIAAGTAGDDVIVGSVLADTLNGGAGNDILSGGVGGDAYTYAAGDGSDVISDYGSDAGADRLVFTNGVTSSGVSVSADGEAGSVSLFIGASTIVLEGQLAGDNFGIEEIEFSDGEIWTRADLLAASLTSASTGGNDVINGFAAADVIAGGAGDDILRGGAGGDIYQYNLGDGADIIVEDGRAGEVDKLVFGAGITLSMLTFTRDASRANDVVVSISGGGGVTIQNALAVEGAGVEEIEFADGSMLSNAQLRQTLLNSALTVNDDSIRGFDSDDTLDALAGNDTIHGGEGDDSLSGNDGDDVINGGVGDDTLDGGAGNDVLIGELGVDVFDGGAGVDTVDFSYSSANWTVDLAQGAASTSANQESLFNIENVTAGAGNDLLIGDNFANILVGGAGDDTLNGGDGDDVLDGGLGVDQFDGGAGNDTVDFSSVQSAFDVDLSLGQVNAADGSTEQLTSIENVIANAAANAITGNSAANRLEGGDGDDQLNGGGGADVLFGEAGADTFIFDANFGNDVVGDFEAGAGGGDLLDLRALGVQSFAEVQAVLSDGVDGAVIDFGGGDSILLQGVASSSLQSDDFLFAA